MIDFLAQTPRFRLVFSVLGAVLPMGATLIGVLLVQLYFFGVIGSWTFSGLIYDGNPALADTGFAQSGYFPLNFNDFASALITLFAMLVGNNWVSIV